MYLQIPGGSKLRNHPQSFSKLRGSKPRNWGVRPNRNWGVRPIGIRNSQDEKTLEKSLRILKSGGKVISISGPPDPTFAKEMSLNLFMKAVIFFLSRKVRSQATKLGIDYSFLFMQANGKHLTEIGKLIESSVIRPVVDKVFSFEQMNEAIDYVSSGRAKGKVIVKVK
ncbi:MAG: zinc-binding dehydrogenase [Saprospiraceae bacterium]